MKPHFCFAALLLALPLANAAEPATRGSAMEINGMAATVNGRVITKSEVSFMLAPIYAQLAVQYPRRGAEFESKLKEARDKILGELIDRALILDEFKQMGASLKTQFVDEEIKRQVREIYNGDENKFREELKKNRLTMDGYRDMTRDKLVVQAMRSKHFSDAPPPLPNEVEKEYAAVRESLRDMSKDKITFQKIFIPRADETNPTATPETQLTLAEGLAKKLQDGADFTEIAKANSKDAFAENGGLIENAPRTDFSAEFANVIFNAELNKINGPLLDPQGFTIVKVIKKEYGPTPPLSQVRDMIEERVRRKKTSAAYEKWIATKRKQAMIKKKI